MIASEKVNYVRLNIMCLQWVCFFIFSKDELSYSNQVQMQILTNQWEHLVMIIEMDCTDYATDFKRIVENETSRFSH